MARVYVWRWNHQLVDAQLAVDYQFTSVQIKALFRGSLTGDAAVWEAEFTAREPSATLEEMIEAFIYAF